MSLNEVIAACPVRASNPGWYSLGEIDCCSSWNNSCRDYTKSGNPHPRKETECRNICAMAEQILANADERGKTDA